MVLFDMLSWWYSIAWIKELEKVLSRTKGIFEAFSVSLLAKTLFAPFRQIDAGSVRGPIDVQVRAWFDRTFSRVFGAIIRTIMIISGCLTAVGVFMLGIAWVAIWLVLPVLPIIGFIMMIVA